MTTSQKREFARMGAEFRLKTIQEEQQAIFRVFPELREGAAARLTSFARRRRRRRMSAAERKAVGARMRAYWAQAPGREGRLEEDRLEAEAQGRNVRRGPQGRG
jgi:hypothetical protein